MEVPACTLLATPSPPDMPDRPDMPLLPVVPVVEVPLPDMALLRLLLALPLALVPWRVPPALAVTCGSREAPAPASTARACRMRASDWARVRLPLCWRASRWVSTGSSKAAPLSSVTVASGAGIWLASAEAGWPVPCCPAAPCPALLSPLRPESVPRAPS